jgi:exopolyphosphatase/guanosine-5'-triphosphate,3'-diphosphate pyrophosphatase
VLLEASALLHDIGVVVNNSGHHKHSHYLIRSSEIVGLTEEERELVALVARYHRRAPPARDQPDYAALKRKDRLLIERLAALLRIADALDRQHSGLLRTVEVAVRDDSVELRPSLVPGQSSPLLLEQRALDDKGGLFADLFGRPVRLVPP